MDKELESMTVCRQGIEEKESKSEVLVGYQWEE